MPRSCVVPVLAALLLAACGGGGGGAVTSERPAAPAAAAVPEQAPAAPSPAPRRAASPSWFRYAPPPGPGPAPEDAAAPDGAAEQQAAAADPAPQPAAAPDPPDCRPCDWKIVPTAWQSVHWWYGLDAVDGGHRLFSWLYRVRPGPAASGDFLEAGPGTGSRPAGRLSYEGRIRGVRTGGGAFAGDIAVEYRPAQDSATVAAVASNLAGAANFAAGTTLRWTAAIGEGGATGTGTFGGMFYGTGAEAHAGIAGWVMNDTANQVDRAVWGALRKD